MKSKININIPSNNDAYKNKNPIKIKISSLYHIFCSLNSVYIMESPLQGNLHDGFGKGLVVVKLLVYFHRKY